MEKNVKPVAHETVKVAPVLEVKGATMFDVVKAKELLTQAVSEAEFKSAIRAAELIREALKLLG